MSLRRDLTLVGALLALTLLGGAQAQAARDPVTAPTLLWKTYPLVQDPLSLRYHLQATAVGAVPPPRPARIPAGGSGISSQTLLLLMLASLVAGAAGLLLLGSTLAHAAYDRSSTRPWRRQRKKPEKPRSDSTADVLVALKPSTAARPEPEEDLLEALEPVAAEPAGEGDEGPEEQDEAVTPVAPERASDPGEGASGPRSGERERRMLAPLPRPPDQSVSRPRTGPRHPKEAAAAGRVQSCEIRLWHGYVKYQLYASSEGPSFALSDFFRLRDEDRPTKKALAELENLITRLEAKGWAVVDEGPRWSDVKFERAD
jgi:hypothetical protein